MKVRMTMMLTMMFMLLPAWSGSQHHHGEISDDWNLIQEGVWVKQSGDRQVFRAVGQHGNAWALDQLLVLLEESDREFNESGDPEILERIVMLEKNIAELTDAEQDDLVHHRKGAAEPPQGCIFDQDQSADAHGSNGAVAEAYTWFSSSCNFYIYADCFANADGLAPVTHFQSKSGTGSHSVTCNATQAGTSGCNATARSYASCSGCNFFLMVTDTSTDCGTPPPMTVTIPTNPYLMIPFSGKVFYPISSTVTGGTAPYTYSWTRNGTYAGNGSSISYSVRHDSSPHDFTVGLTVTDSLGNVATTSKTFHVYLDF